MEQSEKLRLPISHLVPVKKTVNEKEMPDGNGDATPIQEDQSQLSLDSSFTMPSDLDSDLTSIHNEVLVAEAPSHLSEEPSKQIAMEAPAKETDEMVLVRTGLKLKRGNLFKKKRNVDPKTIDLTIRKEQEGPRKTRAELAFIKRQEETAFDRLSKRAQISHREKVANFNKQMEELTEFNDIPKVSWTK